MIMYQHVDGTASDQWCDSLWNEVTCCQPHWQYCHEGHDITSDLYAEQDATEKRLWEGPDGPSEVWVRRPTGDTVGSPYGPWERES
jgi:hypothetical protein